MLVWTTVESGPVSGSAVFDRAGWWLKQRGWGWPLSGHHGELEPTLRAAVAERLGAGRFGLWFGEGVRLGVAGDSLEVGVPNAFFREWIQNHFAGNLIDAGQAVTGRQLRLSFRV